MDSSDGWSSDDEWEETAVASNPETNAIDTPHSVSRTPVVSDTLPVFEIKNLPKTLKIVNMEQEPDGLKLYRCEPAKGNPPGLILSDELQRYAFLHVSIHLLNGKVPKRMRLPDPKKKSIIICRCGQEDESGLFKEHGAFISPSGLSTLFFKKKCVNKQKLDTAFQLGKGFTSTTGGITPQFCIVVTPWSGHHLMTEKAVRTKSFYVFSKRQDRFLKVKKKRNRKNCEIERLDTDIAAAETTLSALQEKLLRLRHKNATAAQKMNTIRDVIVTMPESTAKIALVFSTRPVTQKDPTVDL
jgi:hypothetical protein